MTYLAHVGPGAKLVESTLASLVQSYDKALVCGGIVGALRHLRDVIGFGHGMDGLKRFDADLMQLFYHCRAEISEDDILSPALVSQSGFVTEAFPAQALASQKTNSDIHVKDARERVSALLIDAVESCLLLNSQKNYTSTDVLIRILVSHLVMIGGKDADLGELLLDVCIYKHVMPKVSGYRQVTNLH